MGAALIIAEQKNGSLKKVAKEAISLAHKLADNVEVVVVGKGAKSVVDDLKKYGPSKIYVGEVDAIYSPDGFANAVASIVEKVNPEYIITGATFYGRDMAGRLGARFGAGIATDVIEIVEKDGEKLFKRPVYSGKALALVKIKSDKKIVTIRPNVFPLEEKSTDTQIEEFDVDLSNAKAIVKEFQETGGEEIPLTEADIIVSGGRGLKSAENFQKYIYPLAKKLNAAVGASRAAVDSGYIDYSHQVGQTGKTVSPLLYMAFGISGAIQHLAGMGSSKYIVAVNKDPEAPIFKVATYGIVHDLFDFIPAFMEVLDKEL